MNLHNCLNPQQLKAVLHINGPLLVLAGAGSGKTRVITQRIANLIYKNEAAPYNILAITFTNKAAQEMKDRIKTILGKNDRGIWISTFHSLCVRILHRHIEKIGLRSNFVIYTAPEQTSILKECLKQLNLEDDAYSPKSLLWKIGACKNELATVEDLRSGKKAFSFLDEEFIDIYQAYQKRLRENNALDFDDLIMLTVKLLSENRDVQRYYANLFKYIMVDEYQDTNHAQYRLVKLLSCEAENANICVVGDDDQSIYRWRGANADNIFNFEKDYPDTRVIKLEENYRSTQNILDAANSIIAKNFKRKGKRLWTKKGKGEKIEYLHLKDESAEANFVAQRIKKLNSEGYKYSDIAVFYRINVQSRIIEDSLIRRRIPYQVIGGPRFYDRKEIKDLLAYMRLLVNPDDSVSLKRIINVPRRGIGNITIDKINTYSADKNISLFNGIIDMLKNGMFRDRAEKILSTFIQMIKKLAAETNQNPVSLIIKDIIDDTGYIEELKAQNTLNSEERVSNIQELITAAENFEESGEDISVKGFLDSVSLMSDIDTLNDNKGCVTLMSLHASKGLEFAVVFMVGMENNLFPHRNSFDDISEMEEERRLCYVGTTRAKERLFLSNAARRRIYNKEQYNQPSLFLKDIPLNLINSSAAEHLSDQAVKIITAEEYAVGKKVMHPRWGIGIIKAKDGNGDNLKITAAFPAVGPKRLAVKYASLKMINS